MGKELAEQYENEMFDFEQLSASLVSDIIFVFNFNGLCHISVYGLLLLYNDKSREHDLSF